MLAVAAVLILSLGACAPASTAVPFIPPTAPILSSLAPEPSPTAAALSLAAPTPTPSPATSIVPSSTPTTEACINNLAFIQDLTVEDGSLIQPGGSVEKAWLVTNNGTCDWGPAYRMKLTGGESFNAPTELALYPARAGTQAILRIIFTAPLTTGTYEATWHAFAPDGTVFGDPFYLQILVSGP